MPETIKIYREGLGHKNLAIEPFNGEWPLKLFHINSWDMIKNVEIKLFIRVRRRKNNVSCYFCKSM